MEASRDSDTVALRNERTTCNYISPIAFGCQAHAGAEKLENVMTADATLHRWSDLRLEKVTAMVSCKAIAGDRQTMIQAYLKRGAQIPMHAHEADQLVYILRGALRCLVGTREITVRDGEVLHVPARLRHQAEALEDTFELVVFAPGRWTGQESEPQDGADSTTDC